MASGRWATWRAGGATVTKARPRGERPRVDVAAPPGGYVWLDACSPWLVDRWLRDLAESEGHEVTTDFVPGRVPRSVARFRAEHGSGPEFDEDGNPFVYDCISRS